jgi:hypothetical protein
MDKEVLKGFAHRQGWIGAAGRRTPQQPRIYCQPVQRHPRWIFITRRSNYQSLDALNKSLSIIFLMGIGYQ